MSASNRASYQKYHMSDSEFFGYKKRSKVSMRIGMFFVFIFLLYIAGAIVEVNRTQEFAVIIATLIIFIPCILVGLIPVFIYRSDRRKQNEDFSFWLKTYHNLAPSKLMPGKSGKRTFRRLDTKEKVVCDVLSLKPDNHVVNILGKTVRRHRVSVKPLT